MGDPAFLLEAVALPFVVLAGNSIVRYAAGHAQSAAADVILLLLIFDLVVLLHPEAALKNVPSELFRGMLQPLLAVYIVASMFLWIFAVLKLERALNLQDVKHIDAPRRFPAWQFFAMITISVFVVAANVTPFVYQE